MDDAGSALISGDFGSLMDDVAGRRRRPTCYSFAAINDKGHFRTCQQTAFRTCSTWPHKHQPTHHRLALHIFSANRVGTSAYASSSILPYSASAASTVVVSPTLLHLRSNARADDCSSYSLSCCMRHLYTDLGGSSLGIPPSMVQSQTRHTRRLGVCRISRVRQGRHNGKRER